MLEDRIISPDVSKTSVRLLPESHTYRFSAESSAKLEGLDNDGLIVLKTVTTAPETDILTTRLLPESDT